MLFPSDAPGPRRREALAQIKGLGAAGAFPKLPISYYDPSCAQAENTRLLMSELTSAASFSVGEV
jgi:hypothetical protein